MAKNNIILIFGAFFYLILAFPCLQFLQINHLNISNKVGIDILLDNNYWAQYWGGNSSDYGYGITLDSEGNIYVAGFTDSFGAGNYDMILIKFNNSGYLMWNKTWGGSSSDYGYGIASDSEGNIYVAGSTNSFGAGNSDMFLIKFNNSGYLIWNKTWGGTLEDRCYGIFIDSLDYVYLSGYTHSYGSGNSDICVIKYNNQGIQMWNSTWGTSSNEYCYDDITVDNHFNIYIGGVVNDPESMWNDLCIVKLNSNGDYIWNISWGGDEQETGASIILDSCGDIYLLGNTYSYGSGGSDFCLLKFSQFGTLIWYKTWGGPSNDFGTDIVFDSCANIYLTGSTSSYDIGGYDVSVVRYTQSGEFDIIDVWGGSLFEECRDVTIDSNDNIYLVGTTGSFGVGKDIFILKYFQNPICAISGYDIWFCCLLILFTVFTVLLLFFRRRRQF